MMLALNQCQTFFNFPSESHTFLLATQSTIRITNKICAGEIPQEAQVKNRKNRKKNLCSLYIPIMSSYN